MEKNSENFKEQVSGYFQKIKVQAGTAAESVAKFVKENKELVVTCVPIAVAGIGLGRSHLVSRRTAKERRRIDQTYYDPSTGFHWDLRRKASNYDRAEITRRKALGESTYDILRDLKLIR